MILYIIGIIFLILLLIVGVFFLRKWTIKESIAIQTPNGIDHGEFVEINGIAQFLYHRGENIDNPVVLFLHGGPGSPMLPFAHVFQPSWEREMTVVHWDQRGCGKTFYANDISKMKSTVTMEQMILDAKAVIDYLKQKYGQEKIIIMGHSWGSVLGSQVVLQYPGDIRAYVGVGQVINMFENETVGFEKVLAVAQAAGKKNDVAAIEALLPYPSLDFNDEMKHKITKLRGLQGKYKLATTINLNLVKTVIESPFYRLRDARYFIQADVAGINNLQNDLFNQLMKFDLNTVGHEYRVPFYTIQGEDDWQTPYPLALAYFETVVAPNKEFYTIIGARHTPMLEQTERFNKVWLELFAEITK